MPFSVTVRLGDVVVESGVDSAEEALERASAWTQTHLGEVTISLDGKCFAMNEFAGILEDKKYNE